MVQGGPSGHGQQRQVSVSREFERSLGTHGAVGRSRARLRADPHALGGDDAGALPSASRTHGGEQNVHVDATVVHWESMVVDVYAFVANCTQCARNRVGK